MLADVGGSNKVRSKLRWNREDRGPILSSALTRARQQVRCQSGGASGNGVQMRSAVGNSFHQCNA